MLSDRIQSFLQNAAFQKAVKKVPVGSIAENLESIDPRTLSALTEKISQLPPPLPCQRAVQSTLTQALQLWQTDPDIANNSLVVLGRPVEDVARIVKTSLQNWPSESILNIEVETLLGGYQRPPDPLEIEQHIRRAIDPKSATKGPADKAINKADDEASKVSKSDQPLSIIVVPRLEQCFLRCIHGWKGIEYLQNLTTRDTSRFWVFGCNHWAWAFLDRVCQVSAYLEQPLSLPELSGEDLRAWLNPVFNESVTETLTTEKLTTTEVRTTETSTEKGQPSMQLQDPADSYWTSLSYAASGMGATAVWLWLDSLRVTANMTEGTTGGSAKEAKETLLSTVKPTLPGLMSLETIDRYVLHTLLIHGEMTRAHLALSLGEAERKVRSRLQVLRREGIILQRGRRLSVNPAHYPRLFSELKNNNFLIGAR